MVQVSSPVQPGYRAPDHGAWTGTFSALERAVWCTVSLSHTCTRKGKGAKSVGGHTVRQDNDAPCARLFSEISRNQTLE